MNRTASEAAKVLGVDSALVKQWAFLFKENLSAAANPARGKVRIFSDADMLALCYVGYLWEDHPDLESIRIGLNQENQYEEPFVEHLYFHTPLLQELPDEIDETWRHGILLCGCGRHDFLELARNYRTMAESMLQAALERDDVRDSAYPVLFAYRHTLELYLKLIGEIDEPTHSLAKCVHLVEKRWGEKFSIALRGWILELGKADPMGTAFRYADERSDLADFEEYWFDFRHFQFAMNLVFNVLDRAILRTGARGKPAKNKRGTPASRPSRAVSPKNVEG